MWRCRLAFDDADGGRGGCDVWLLVLVLGWVRSGTAGSGVSEVGVAVAGVGGSGTSAGWIDVAGEPELLRLRGGEAGVSASGAVGAGKGRTRGGRGVSLTAAGSVTVGSSSSTDCMTTSSPWCVSVVVDTLTALSLGVGLGAPRPAPAPPGTSSWSLSTRLSGTAGGRGGRLGAASMPSPSTAVARAGSRLAPRLRGAAVVAEPSYSTWSVAR